MSDDFAGHAATLFSPGERHQVITASPNAISPRPRCLRFGGAGTVTIVDQADVAVTYTVAAGEVMPFRGVKVTATTVSQIVGWW